MSDSEAAAAAVTGQSDLNPPSLEEAPTAQVQVEEEEVTYDEEPDEDQQADGLATAGSGEHSDVQQVPLHRLSRYLCRQAECSTRAA